MTFTKVVLFSSILLWANWAVADEGFEAVMACGDVNVSDGELIKSLETNGWQTTGKDLAAVLDFMNYAASIDIAHKKNPSVVASVDLDWLIAYVKKNIPLWKQLRENSILKSGIQMGKFAISDSDTDLQQILMANDTSNVVLELILSEPGVRICNFYVEPLSAIGKLRDRMKKLGKKQIAGFTWSTEKGETFDIDGAPVNFVATTYDRDLIQLAWPVRVNHTVKLAIASPRSKSP